MRKIFILISFGLLTWLVVESVSQIDFAATKNDALINYQKFDIDRFENIDSLKTAAKLRLDVIRQNQRTKSRGAIKQFWFLLIIIGIQIFIVTFWKGSKLNTVNDEKLLERI